MSIFQSRFASASTPIFILGCQRSGTTIGQEVFLNSRGCAVYGESNKEAMDDSWRLRSYDDIQRLIDSAPAKTLVFKPINDSQSALQMLERFDDARVVWFFRDFVDTACSAVAKWGPAQREMVVWIGEAMAKHGSLQEAMPAILEKPSFAVYAEKLSEETAELLVEWTREPLSEFSGAAVLWYLRNQLLFDQRLDSNDRVLLVRYEKFGSEPDKQLRRICKFMDTSHKRRRAKRIFATSIGKNEVPEMPESIRRSCESLQKRLQSAEKS